MEIFLYSLLALFVIFVLILVVRALLFKPADLPEIEAEEISLNEKKIVDDMVEMIKCKTVSNRDESLVDRAEFAKFEALLKERFPNIHKTASLQKIGETGLLYHIEGESSEKPSVCMAHYDVVPVNEELWTKPAFDGLVEDGFIWGRGTLDTKGTLCALMEALESMLESGYKPKNDLYLSFSGEEEIDGESCAEIVSYFESKGIKPAFVLDEGGAVVNNVFPGVSRECALIGIAEKGGVNLKFSIDSNGGHASTPPVHTVLGKLSDAVMRIENKPFRYQLVKPVREMFDKMGRNSSFVIKLVFANLWCFAPLLAFAFKKLGGEMNAMLRTTVAVTRMQGSDAYNVLPPSAYFGVNMRLLGNDTIESAVKYLKKVIKNDDISIEVVNGMNPSICSDTSCKEWGILEEAIRESWSEAIVSPYLMMACSDSRHYCRITDRVYRFSAMRLSKEERAMIHGNNERIPIETLLKTVEFYTRLLKKL